MVLFLSHSLSLSDGLISSFFFLAFVFNLICIWGWVISCPYCYLSNIFKTKNSYIYSIIDLSLFAMIYCHLSGRFSEPFKTPQVLMSNLSNSWIWFSQENDFPIKEYYSDLKALIDWCEANMEGRVE